MPIDDAANITDTAYGPAGHHEAGSSYPKKYRPGLATSYAYLEHALKLLKGYDFEAWMSLVTPYLGDPADPSVVADWREKARDIYDPSGKLTRRGYLSARLFVERHDRAIEKLSCYLANVDLRVLWPARMTNREREQVKRRNDELYEWYAEYRSSGMSRGKAIEKAGKTCGYSRRRAYEIVDLREPPEKRKGRAS